MFLKKNRYTMIFPSGIKKESRRELRKDDIIYFLEDNSCNNFTGLIDGYLKNQEEIIKFKVVFDQGKVLLAHSKLIKKEEEEMGLDFVKKILSEDWDSVIVDLISYSNDDINVIRKHYKDQLIYGDSGMDICLINTGREDLLKKYRLREPTADDIEKILNGCLPHGSGD